MTGPTPARTPATSKSARRAQRALQQAGLDAAVVEMPASTHTAAQAAAAIGCAVAQICKSLVFRTAAGDAVLVIASGPNRVAEDRIAAVVGEPVAFPAADFVKQRTGFSIGGVPPAGHPQPLRTLIDQDLLAFDEIWAAAGTPRAVFRLTPADLQRVTAGQVIAVARDSARDCPPPQEH